MERGNASIPELTSLKGKLFAHLGPFPQSFSTSPQTARGRGAWPLHLRATDIGGEDTNPAFLWLMPRCLQRALDEGGN